MGDEVELRSGKLGSGGCRASLRTRFSLFAVCVSYVFLCRYSSPVVGYYSDEGPLRSMESELSK